MEAGLRQVPQGHRTGPDMRRPRPCWPKGRGRPDDASIRQALTRWGFNTKQRSDPPAEVADVLAWVARNSAPVSALAEAATARRMLDQATGRLDGKTAAASTARRHRTILANAMDYAVEQGLLETNPIRALKWTAPKVSSQVDRRSVVNPGQARALLEAVRAQQPSGPRLVTFFAVMYYAGLRPEEAINLRGRQRDPVLLRADPTMKTGASCTSAARRPTRVASGPTTAARGSDDSSSTGPKETAASCRPIPSLRGCCGITWPKFGTAADGRLFGGVRGGELPTITYRRAWIKARQVALTEAEQASPLARRPYDLRHACLSTWLNGGVYPTQVAEWAGHGVNVLLRIYAKCVVGQDELAKRRISEALRQD